AWREDPPNQYAALRIADIDAKLVDGAGIKLGMARRGRKSAMQRLRRAKDKTPAAGDTAGQRADPYAALCLRRGWHAGRQADQTDRCTKFFEHFVGLFPQ